MFSLEIVLHSHLGLIQSAAAHQVLPNPELCEPSHVPQSRSNSFTPSNNSTHLLPSTVLESS